MIPKTIHYCWFGPKPIPKLVIKCINTWKKKLPEYTIILWNEKNSPMDIDFVKQAYKSKKYAFVSDYVRFWVLYNEGGIYLDTDMFVVKSLDPLLQNKLFFGWETPEKSSISCGIIGTEKGNPFLKLILDEYAVISFDRKNIEDLIVPRIVSKIYGENISHYENKIKLYPYDYFYPFPFNKKEEISTFLDYKTDNTYAIHLWNLSWVTSYRKALYLFVKKIKKLKAKLINKPNQC
jgi:mannosyltransferase OCH1-like enzyme